MSYCRISLKAYQEWHCYCSQYGDCGACSRSVPKWRNIKRIPKGRGEAFGALSTLASLGARGLTLIVAAVAEAEAPSQVRAVTMTGLIAEGEIVLRQQKYEWLRRKHMSVVHRVQPDSKENTYYSLFLSCFP